MGRLLKPEEVADLCGVGLRTVYRWIQSGALPVVEFSHRCKRIRPEDLSEFIESRRNGLLRGNRKKRRRR